MTSIAPPGVTVRKIPVDGLFQAIIKRNVLVPSQRFKLRVIQPASFLRIWTAGRDFDPIVDVGAVAARAVAAWRVDDIDETRREVSIADLVDGTQIEYLTALRFVQDCIKGIGGILGVQVSLALGPAAVKRKLVALAEEHDEFGYDL